MRGRRKLFWTVREAGDSVRIEYRHSYAAPPEVVWEFLQDERVLQKRLPGCKRLIPVGDGRYEMEMGLDVGPIKGLFTGYVQLSDLNPPREYRLQMHGSGKPGEVAADARISLEEAVGKTDLLCVAEAKSAGVIASVGQRVMGGVAKLLLGQFFKGVELEIQARTTEAR